MFELLTAIQGQSFRFCLTVRKSISIACCLDSIVLSVCTFFSSLNGLASISIKMT